MVSNKSTMVVTACLCVSQELGSKRGQIISNASITTTTHPLLALLGGSNFTIACQEFT